jgi:hypothetical protein
MAYVGVGETSAYGYLPTDGHVFINVYVRLKKTHIPELHIKTTHPHYLIQRFIDAHTFPYQRHIDNCFKVPTEYANEFVNFITPIHQELETLNRRVNILDTTVSEDIHVADLDAFHSGLNKCHTLIDEIGHIEHGASFYKLMLEGITQRNQQDIPNITTWNEQSSTTFSQPLARTLPEHQQCLRTRVSGSLELKHKPPTQPDQVIDLEREYSFDELRAHYRSYVDLLAKQKRIEDLLAVEKKLLKVAIGVSQSFRNLFSWSRREVTEVDPTAFRRLYPDLYEQCKVTSEPKWKCEILPFRG